MPRLGWDCKVNIKQYFVDTDEEAEARLPELHAKVAAELNGIKEFLDEDAQHELGSILESMEMMASDKDLEGYNYELDNLYDWADYNNVWLGL